MRYTEHGEDDLFETDFFVAEPEVYMALKQVIEAEVAAAIADQRAVETLVDLEQVPWILDGIVDRVMSVVEERGIDFQAEQLVNIVVSALISLLPAGSRLTTERQQTGEQRPDDGDSSTGVREPRRPFPHDDSGSIELEFPREAA